MTRASTQPDTDPLLTDLTEPQRQAVTHVDGPLLVIAGPGSGKTRVITRRIAYLCLRVGIPSWSVLAITFTNKAAGEMRERVMDLLEGHPTRGLTVATFHSLCARLIRQHAERLGLPPSYSIYDSGDQARAMKTALEALEMSTSNFPPASVLATISNAKNDLVDADAYARAAGGFYEKSIAKIYKKYEQILEQNHALDFDDLLMRTVQLLRKHPDVLTELQERYQYVLIDEYQDTNHAQFLIAHALAGPRQNICATGDPDQSIYGWRGANLSNILEFETHYPTATVVRLEQNYRSTGHILAVADALIQYNQKRKHKALWTDNETGERVHLVTVEDERAEAQWLVDQFERLRDEMGLTWSSFAIFYRINSLSRVLEETLRLRAVPYQIARGTAFYERKEIKDAVAYLRAIANPADEVNLLRIINTPARGISGATVKALQAYSVAHDVPVNEVITRPAAVTSLNTRAVNAVERFAKLLAAWRLDAGFGADAPRRDGSLRGLVERVLRESGLEDYYRSDKSDPDGERFANLGELVTSAQQFELELEQADADDDASGDAPTDDQPTHLAAKLIAYLERVSLVSDVDAIEGGQGAVTLMTLHAAKGLEFPVVAMAGVEDGLLPHQRAATSDSEMEEERRLCFVGITRAQRMLILTRARYRTIFGQTLPTIESRFLRELPEDHVVEEKLAADDVHDPRFDTGRPGSDDLARYAPGTAVRHPQFGYGHVLTARRFGGQSRVQIEFEEVGVKTLVLQYCRLDVVD